MGDKPYFPAPGPREAETSLAPPWLAPPYRVASVPERSKPTSPPVTHRAIPEGGVVARRLDELARRRSRRMRDGWLQIGIGLALLVGGVLVTLASRGDVIWYGAAFAGVLSALRGAMQLLGLTGQT